MSHLEPMLAKQASGAHPGDSPATAEDFVRSIRGLLDRQQFTVACQRAARAAELHPEHPWLARAHRVLNPDRVTRRPARGQGRAGEFSWLRQNSEAWRGRWVALLGEELIAGSESLQEVLAAVHARGLDGQPLVHFVE